MKIYYLLFGVIVCIGCNNSSEFDIEYKKTQTQLDSISTLLLNKMNQSNEEKLHSFCLFKKIETNCNFRKEGILHIGMGVSSFRKDSIEVSFGLPFGNYSLKINSNTDSTNIEFIEFYKKSENILKYNIGDELTNSLSIPLEYEIIEFENKTLDSNIYELWGKLRTKEFIKTNIYKNSKVHDNCYWELEFLAKINLLKF